jgi:hypothetical protein
MGAAGGSTAANYIEDVFSTYLYTGNGYSPTSQTIVNNIDLATKGGMTWIKCRSGGYTHFINDTVRGAGNVLQSNTTSPNQPTTSTFGLTAFNSNGFKVEDDGNGPGGYLIGQGGGLNGTGNTFSSWTFRKQPKFFDVVTYTGTGSNRTIAHSLGSTPGVIIIKQTSASGRGWITYHRSIGATGYLDLSQTNATDTWSIVWNNTAPTSTEFTVGTFAGVNESGQTYVAYLFAHDAGGFGLTGTDNVISCGSFTADGSGAATVNLGYETQTLIAKVSSASGNWFMVDTMRGWPVTASDSWLQPNTSGAESTGGNFGYPTSTGFVWNYVPSSNYIYIAIRRGPMKVPTDATKVFQPVAYTGNGTTRVISTSPMVVPDQLFIQGRSGASTYTSTRLAGSQQYLSTQSTAAEANGSPYWISMDVENGYQISGSSGGGNSSGVSYIAWAMSRAPNFFDEVCYTGDGTTNRQLNHNLTVVPELIIAKRRSGAQDWVVFGSALGANNYLILNTTGALNPYGAVTLLGSTSTTFGAQANLNYNDSAVTYVAYLFASCPGVSKVFSFTGNGSTQTINCGFTGGARFVLLKATSTTGGWYVYDTARGMTTLTDPYLFLNSTAAESATLGSVTTVTTGFAVNESILAGVNTNGVSYIGIAIA